MFVSEEAHYTIFTALRLLGLGAERLHRVPTDEQGRMRADALAGPLSRGFRALHRLRAGRQRQHRRVRSD